jgi:hypothetical protein
VTAVGPDGQLIVRPGAWRRGERASERLDLRVTPTTLRELDLRRGKRSRAQYIADLVANDVAERCPDCGGAGSIPYEGERGDDWVGVCSTCAGSGWV